jgi:hypothetical protein
LKYKHQNNNKAREEVPNMNARRTVSKRPFVIKNGIK